MTLSRRTAAAGLLLVVSSILLAGCSGDTPVARDTAPAPTSTAPSPPPTPTASPTVGTYPDFGPEDYAFTLEVSCFCVGDGPIRVVVVGGDVATATYLAGGRSRGSSTPEPGSPAPDYRRLTIDDVIAAANDTEAAHVDVVWPAGQDHPTSVFVDQDEQIADEEMGYAVTDVVVSDGEEAGG